MEIQDIKANLSIERILTHYNLKADRNNRLCCPWHNDKTPSLQIYRRQIHGHASVVTVMQEVAM